MDLLDLIDQREGGGGYDTLFSYAEREGGDFAGVRPSAMTLGQLRDFTTGPYAEWSRQRLGYTATPVGRYQIVGQTMRGLQEELGLPDETVFDRATQDRMGAFLVDRALGSKDPKRALRQTWEGLRGVSDEDLDRAIAAHRQGLPGVAEQMTQIAARGSDQPGPFLLEAAA